MADSPNTRTLSEFHSRRSALARIAGTLALPTGVVGAVAVQSARAKDSEDAEVCRLSSLLVREFQASDDLGDKVDEGGQPEEKARCIVLAREKDSLCRQMTARLIASPEPTTREGVSALAHAVLHGTTLRSSLEADDPVSMLVHMTLSAAARLGGRL